MKDASFRHSIQDIDTPILKRSYSSRSIYNGYFGFGWCTDIEKSLKNLGNELILSDCRLQNDISYRILSRSKTKTTYQSVLDKNDNIEFENGTYTRRFGEIQKFNMWGQLFAVSSGGGTFVTFSFEESGRLDRGVLSDGRVLQFFWDPNINKIITVKASSDTVLYKYENSNLRSVTKNQKLTHSYQYDTLNNLIEITLPDSTIERISYDFRKDWVTQVKSKCTENYSYRTTHDRGLILQTTTLEKRCANQGLVSAKYEYWYKDNLLTRTRVMKDTSVIDIRFDSNGNATQVDKKNFSFTSRYISNFPTNGGTKWQFLR